MRRQMSLHEKFEKHVIRQNGCWKWRGFHAGGYGMSSWPGTKHGNKPLQAYRLAYILYNGPIPKGLLVRHVCNNRGCVNPDHLILGTYKDNHNDAVKAGTWTRGAKQGTSKFTENDIRMIRQLRREGMCLKDLAARYGVGKTTICNITKRRNWAWVEDLPLAA